MADSAVYILVTFTANNEFGICTLEAIAVPKHFREESFFNRLQQLRNFVGTKRVIGINWPKFPIRPGWSVPLDSSTPISPVQYELRSCKIVTFSEDKDVVVAVRNSMMKTSIGSHIAVAKKSAPKSAATIPQLLTGGDEDNGNVSDDTCIYDDDSQKINSTSESEDEDVIPPSQPLPPAKRKRASQCEKSVSKAASKKNYSHNKENDPFVTPHRNKKLLANKNDSQILTSLDVNIFDTPPSSTTKTTKKGNPKRVLEQVTEPVFAELQLHHLRSEYIDEINELKKQISFLNEQIGDSTVQLEIEREDWNQKIVEKDTIIVSLQEEIRSLKELNPQALAKSLNEGLAQLHTTLETLTIGQVSGQQSRFQLERSESCRTNNL